MLVHVCTHLYNPDPPPPFLEDTLDGKMISETTWPLTPRS